MEFLPYFGFVLLRVDSLRGGPAEGNRIFKTDFFDVLTIHYDQITYMKHVLDTLYVFSPHLGVGEGMGGL